MTTIDIETPHGPARAHVEGAGAPRGALVLGHGAGGGIGARDLVAAAEAARGAGFVTALVEQPYRVAGRRSPAPAGQLDAAWAAVLARLAGGPFAGLEIVTGGRSSGARVACRTAAQTGAAGVLCLAFPLQPPRRPSRTRAPRAEAPDARAVHALGERRAPADRLHELDAVIVPVLVVQGERDPFGMPPPGPRRTVVRVPGDHSLRSAAAEVAAAVGEWLDRGPPRA